MWVVEEEERWERNMRSDGWRHHRASDWQRRRTVRPRKSQKGSVAAAWGEQGQVDAPELGWSSLLWTVQKAVKLSNTGLPLGALPAIMPQGM